MGETEKAIYHFELALFSIGMIACFGFIMPWRSCFPAKAGSTTHAVNNTPLRLSDVCISLELNAQLSLPCEV